MKLKKKIILLIVMDLKRKKNKNKYGKIFFFPKKKFIIHLESK